MNKISVVLEVLHSKTDLYGNRYFSMTVTNTLTNQHAKGIISGGESNCTYAIRKLVDEYFPNTEYWYAIKEMPIREYNRMVKNWPYIGCTQDEINKNIIDQWNNDKLA